MKIYTMGILGSKVKFKIVKDKGRLTKLNL